MTTTRPLPPHGTEGRYSGTPNRPKCRCTKCKLAFKHAAYRRARNRALYGGSLISRELLVEHVTVLQAAGMNAAAIARAANVCDATISYIKLGKVRSCRRAVALRILAVQPGDVAAAETQPALPIRRRVRALYAAGHGCEAIAAATGVGTTTVFQISRGKYENVERRIAVAIREAYPQLARTPGKSTKARNVARRNGWPDPTWWEDYGGIDDPTAPETEQVVETTRAEVIAEDGLWLRAQGYSDELAAERLGITKTCLQQSIKRARQRQREQQEAAA